LFLALYVALRLRARQRKDEAVSTFTTPFD
jgi:hypothetical protein